MRYPLTLIRVRTAGRLLWPGNAARLGTLGLVAAIVVSMVPARSAAHLAHTTDTEAGQFLSQEEALHRAFPSADRIEERAFFVAKAQAAEVEKLVHAPLESRLWTFFVGRQDAEVLGYAVIDHHVVRTLPQAVMVTLDASGVVRRVELLAFHERFDRPVDKPWMLQFEGKRLTDELTLGRDLARPDHRTPSAKAVATAVRRVLALHHVLVRDAQGR